MNDLLEISCNAFNPTSADEIDVFLQASQTQSQMTATPAFAPVGTMDGRSMRKRSASTIRPSMTIKIPDLPKNLGISEQTTPETEASQDTTQAPKFAGGKLKKKSHARKQPQGHIPRPRNAFILFRKHITDNNLIPTSIEVKHQNISLIASKMWKEAPPDVKNGFVEAANKEKAEHAQLYPNYRYQPAYKRADIVRRRVRKDPNEEDKCDAVASLLIQGKAGKKLETEVKTELAKIADDPQDPSEIQLITKRGRRRRKDAPGELSKGAVRAERAAARAIAMRQQWKDTSLFLPPHQRAQLEEISRRSRQPGTQKSEQRYKEDLQAQYYYGNVQEEPQPRAYYDHQQRYSDDGHTQQNGQYMPAPADGYSLPYGHDEPAHYEYAPLHASGVNEEFHPYQQYTFEENHSMASARLGNTQVLPQSYPQQHREEYFYPQMEQHQNMPNQMDYLTIDPQLVGAEMRGPPAQPLDIIGGQWGMTREWQEPSNMEATFPHNALPQLQVSLRAFEEQLPPLLEHDLYNLPPTLGLEFGGREELFEGLLENHERTRDDEDITEYTEAVRYADF